MPSPKSSSPALAKRIKAELARASARLDAVLQSESKFRPLLKKASRADRHAVNAAVKQLKGKYKRLLNLVGF